MRNLLLVIIAAGVLVIAGVLVYGQLSGPREHSDRWRAAQDKAETSNEIYCTLGGVVPGMTGLNDPAYLRCVREETRRDMEQWEQDHPDAVYE